MVKPTERHWDGKVSVTSGEGGGGQEGMCEEDKSFYLVFFFGWIFSLHSAVVRELRTMAVF